jgi:hypothetical protein
MAEIDENFVFIMDEFLQQRSDMIDAMEQGVKKTKQIEQFLVQCSTARSVAEQTHQQKVYRMTKERENTMNRANALKDYLLKCAGRRPTDPQGFLYNRITLHDDWDGGGCDVLTLVDIMIEVSKENLQRDFQEVLSNRFYTCHLNTYPDVWWREFNDLKEQCIESDIGDLVCDRQLIVRVLAELEGKVPGSITPGEWIDYFKAPLQKLRHEELEGIPIEWTVLHQKVSALIRGIHTSKLDTSSERPRDPEVLARYTDSAPKAYQKPRRQESNYYGSNFKFEPRLLIQGHHVKDCVSPWLHHSKGECCFNAFCTDCHQNHNVRLTCATGNNKMQKQPRDKDGVLCCFPSFWKKSILSNENVPTKTNFNTCTNDDRLDYYDDDMIDTIPWARFTTTDPIKEIPRL